MSGTQSGAGVPPGRSASISNGPPSAGIVAPSPQQAGNPAQGQSQNSQQNLNQIVLEYLSKKGYNKTEAMLRRESAVHDNDGRPVVKRLEDEGGRKYQAAFQLLREWIDQTLDIYKPELRRLLWPVFVYFIISAASEGFSANSAQHGEQFYNAFKDLFTREHEDDLRALAAVRLPSHIDVMPITKIYRSHKYRLTLTNMAFNALVQFLESRDTEGGTLILNTIQQNMNVVQVNREAAGYEKSLTAMLARKDEIDVIPAEDEGVPGHNPGSANIDRNAPPVLAKLNLGPLPMDPDQMDDVRAQLQEEDAKNPPAAGQNSLVEEFEQRIKREPTDDAPGREQVPLPPPLARDVAMEVQKVREHRDRFKLEGRTGGIGPGVSVIMYTFHNTFDSVNCLDFSGDQALVAAGMAESYIRIWSLDGRPLPNPTPQADQTPNEPAPKPVSSRRLIGHSGPVYAVSFSPATASPPTSSDGPTTSSKYLLSSSADKTIRLWSLEAYSCLCAYRAHDSPIWDVTWSPHGHYFASASHDRTARLWSTDHIEPLRMFVAHDNDVDAVRFHPNGNYVFTAGADRTVRMWDVARGSPVRMFTGHTGNVTALECAPNGACLASADDTGAILLWDLTSGVRMKRMRGHGKGGVWSLSWSVEANVLVSGGADGTVRVWDCQQTTAESSALSSAKGVGSAGVGEGSSAASMASAKDGPAAPAPGVSAGVQAATATAVASAQGKKAGVRKDVVVTPDQISVFPTKKSPVYKVGFTRMNLVLAGGAYMP